MGVVVFLHILCITTFFMIFTPGVAAGDDITSCCNTDDGCCGPDWGLHCCNFVAKICCYGDERVHAMHHHNHRHWRWDRHWLQVTLYIVLLVLLITGFLLCCKGNRRQGRGLSEYTVLPGYEYGSQPLYPTAPVQRNFPSSDEYPLTDYHGGQSKHSVNSNITAQPPPYCEAA